MRGCILPPGFDGSLPGLWSYALWCVGWLGGVGGFFILVGGLGTGILFYGVSNLSLYFFFLAWAPWLAPSGENAVFDNSLVNVVYTIFLSNNCASFHLW